MTEMKAFAEQIAGTMNMEENGTKKFRIWEKRKINGTVSFGIFLPRTGAVLPRSCTWNRFMMRTGTGCR